MPRPLKDESEEAFVQRYMASPEAQESFGDSKQRLAVAYSVWENRHKKLKKKKRSIHNIKEYRDQCYGGRCVKLASGINVLDHENKDKKITTNPSKMSAEGIFITQDRDRQGDVMLLEGVDLSSHMDNSCVLLDHGLSHPLPIGVTRDPEGNYSIKMDKERGIGTQVTYFAQKCPIAEQVFYLIEQDILRGNSIGFRPIRWRRLPLDPSLGECKSNRLIQEAEMVELSWTSVPANRFALTTYLESDKIQGKSIAPCIKSMLSAYAIPRNPSWSAGVTLDKETKQMPTQTPEVSTKSIDTPQSWVSESLGAPLVDNPPSKTSMDLSKPHGDTELKDKSQDFKMPSICGVFVTHDGGGVYKVIMRTPAGDLQENMITGRNQAEQYGQRLANEHNLPVYLELDIAVIANKDGTRKKSLTENKCSCKDKSNCNCGVRNQPDTVEGTVDEILDIAQNKKNLRSERKNMATNGTLPKNGKSPKVVNDCDDGTKKVEQGKEAGPQGGAVKPQKPKSVKRTPEYKASEDKQQPKFNGTEKVEQGEEAGSEGGQDVKAIDENDEEIKRMNEPTPEGGPEGGESGHNEPGDPEEEHPEFMETSEPDEEVKDDLEDWESDLNEGEEPLSAITLRDLHADLQKVHKVYSEAIRLMEHAKIKDYINKFLEAMMKGVSEVEQMFSKEHPDQPPLSRVDDGAEPDMEMEDMEEVEPEMEGEGGSELGEEPEMDIDAEVKEPGGDMEDVEESIEEPEDVPPKKNFTSETKGFTKSDHSELDEIKGYIEDMAGESTNAPSRKAALKHCSSRIKAMLDKYTKAPKIRPKKDGVVIKAAGQSPEGTTENKEQALEKKIKKGSQDSPPENQMGMDEKAYRETIAFIEAAERKQQRQKQLLGIA